MKTNPFLQTMYNLRQDGELILFGTKHKLSNGQDAEVIDLLAAEYEREAVGYPYTAPDFAPDAALWAAKMVFSTAHLMLHRELAAPELSRLVFNYSGSLTPSVFLSADLCLRFLPQLVIQLKGIDQNDPLIKNLLSVLQQFHYSALGFDLVDFEKVAFGGYFSNACTKRLYLDRIWERSVFSVAILPGISNLVFADLGDHEKALWPELHL
ncbi:MAG: hypothetical protein EOO01_07295, partial [Chitinophagaceae bacterium]